MMGTFIEVTSPDKEAAVTVFAEFNRIENLLSKYKPESEVSKLNNFGELVVSPETFYVIKRAKEFCELTDGAFDITVGPLVDLWGFNQGNYRVPEEKEIRQALTLVGSDKITLNSATNMVKFKIPGMKIDLGAIAKGYALDCAVKKLKERKVKSCLINAGGQVFALGENSGNAWRIAVKDPRSDDIIDYLEVKDKSVATSGDYEQYFIKGNKRYSHILNPKTGYPTDSKAVSVTVIADNGLTADALATAIFVLGRTKGADLAKKFKEINVRILEEGRNG